MPDMGFPHDRHGPPPRPPRDWNEALTALPLDTPDSDAWARLAARLPIAGGDGARTAAVTPAATGAGTRTAPARRPLAWLAMAAALAAVVAIPLQWLERTGHDDARPPASGPATVSAEPATVRPATARPESAGDRAARPAATRATAAHEPRIADGHALATADTATASASRPAPDGHARDQRDAADATTSRGPSDPQSTSVPSRQDSRRAAASVPSQGIGTGDASTASSGTAAAGHADDGVAAPGPAIRHGDAAGAVARADDDLERLYAESARLEALVAIARDDSMASASATLLTASLDERIGRIDSALSQSGLDRGRRLRLWQSRIDALHELAGVETTQRWLSAHGESWDTALVQID